MAMFPSQRKIMYAGSTVLNNGSFNETHTISLPKDLSILNRRGYASTTRKGVPLVYKVAATVYPSGLDGSGYVTSVSSDVKTTVKFLGCQNNWVMKNAAVKWHAARENMFRRAGIRKKQLGAYAHEIRYNWDEAATTFTTPVDGDGAAFTGGTWDTTVLHTEDDPAGFTLKLTGIGLDADSDVAATAIQIGQSYLTSRSTVPDDSNLESSNVPGELSILRDMLTTVEQHASLVDDVTETAADDQDNPPYDVITAGDTNNDITESVELGRLVLLPQGSGASLPQTVIMDVPFGIMNVLMAHRDPGDDSGIEDDLALGLEVLDIYEMQG